MVIKAVPVLETDKRITILTKERGKIAAFARGAKKAGSRFMAQTEPFAFGRFQLYEGKQAYTLAEVHISDYFESLRVDFINAYYAMYFSDLADYYTRENNDEREMLKLMYASLKALSLETIPNELVECIYEMKTLAVNGEFPGVIGNHNLSETAEYAISHVASCSIDKLFTFTVSDRVLEELKQECSYYRKHYIGKQFKSYEILKSCIDLKG